MTGPGTWRVLIDYKARFIPISERFRQFYFSRKRSTLLLEKSRKINYHHLFFIEQHAKLLPFFVNASRSGEKLKKGTFLEKKAGILSFRVKIF